MAEDLKTAPNAKSKPALAPVFEMPKFDIPKLFEMPKFEMPNMEVPAAFREMAEKSVAQAKEHYEKMKSAAEEATDVLEDTYANASKGCSAYGLKLIENARANTDAAFDLMTELMTSKSIAETVELTSSYMRKQFDAFTAQAKDLTEHAQKLATETAEPIKEGFNAAIKKAA